MLFTRRKGQRITAMPQILRSTCLLVLLFHPAFAKPVHVLIWDEQQPRQEIAYDNLLLGNEIASRLKSDDFEIRSVSIRDV